MKAINKIKIAAILCVLISVTACNENNKNTPKPYGYFRIDMPQNTYQQYENGEQAYDFEYSAISQINTTNENWINIFYPQHKATIYITYHQIQNNLATLINDSHTFTYRHTIKADAIDENLYIFPEHKVFGMIAELEGNAASPIQFIATDSTRNFLRGSLYFDVEPNRDSVAPVVDFIRKDIVHLLKTIKWKK